MPATPTPMDAGTGRSVDPPDQDCFTDTEEGKMGHEGIPELANFSDYGSETNSQIVLTAEDDQHHSVPGQPPRHRQWLALLVVLVISASQVSASQLTKSVQAGLKAPFFVMWIHTAEMSICLPLARLLAAPGSQIVASARDVGVFLGLWVVANYCFTGALALAPAGLVQALFGTAPACVALLSRWVLLEPLTWRRSIAVVLALIGATAVGGGARHSFFGTGDLLESVSLGAIFALIAVMAAACYKVGFKARFGEPDAAVVLGFAGTMGVTMAIVGLPVAILLGMTGVEDEWWLKSANVNWGLLLGGGALDVIYNTSIAYGLSISSPVFVALGTILSVPSNLTLDALLHDEFPTRMEAIGAIIVITSFALLVTEPRRSSEG